MGAEGAREAEDAADPRRRFHGPAREWRRNSTVTIDRDRASRYGITPQLIDDTLNDALGQRQVVQYYTQLSTYNVVLEILPELQGMS